MRPDSYVDFLFPSKQGIIACLTSQWNPTNLDNELTQKVREAVAETFADRETTPIPFTIEIQEIAGRLCRSNAEAVCKEIAGCFERAYGAGLLKEILR